MQAATIHMVFLLFIGNFLVVSKSYSSELVINSCTSGPVSLQQASHKTILVDSCTPSNSYSPPQGLKREHDQSGSKAYHHWLYNRQQILYFSRPILAHLLYIRKMLVM